MSGPPPWTRRLGRPAANLGLAAASLACALLAGEGLVRLLSPIGPALLVTDPVVGKRFAPGYQGRVFVDEAGREVDVRINSSGFPGPEWPGSKPPGGLRIAVVGDSMTAGIATEEERRFVSRLASSLAAASPGRTVEVLNFGVSSASTGSELVTWREVAARYRPDVVLLAFFTGNDLGDNSARLTRAPRVYFDLDGEGRLRQGEDPGDPGPRPLARPPQPPLRLAEGGVPPAPGTTHAAARSIEPGQRIFARDGGPDVEHAWRVTAALLGRLREEVEASGSRFALVVVPCAEQVDDALWAELAVRARGAGLELEREEPSRRLAEICARAGIPACRPHPGLRRRGAGPARRRGLGGRSLPAGPVPPERRGAPRGGRGDPPLPR